MDDLTAFQRDLLYIITGLENGTPPHGIAIKDSLEEDYTGEIHHGRLYPNLDTLAEMGLIEVSAIDKRTNAYSVTQRGRCELGARREWECQHVDLRDD
ncbi:helix-turn-helix transcriptional regulator [Halococcus salsus]|uniref:helix-turn-helix transcriptional regulator n=1 Tax=Halococcus salsus TaxID=2162894 RepID=UPI001357ABFC|nr:helix-turn-helix transcriptional regulator [Halococcus salsus]